MFHHTHHHYHHQPGHRRSARVLGQPTLPPNLGTSWDDEDVLFIRTFILPEREYECTTADIGLFLTEFSSGSIPFMLPITLAFMYSLSF